MKKLLNTLYVSTQGASLTKDGENLVVTLDQNQRSRVPLHMLDSVVLFGAIHISPAIMGACATKGISIALLDWSGRFQARVEGPVSGNVLLRRAQYAASDGGPENIAGSFVAAKIANQRSVLMRMQRDHSDRLQSITQDTLKRTIDRLSFSLRYLAEGDPLSLDELRGVEGDAAQLYFAHFNHLILCNDPAMTFSGRSRRPPLDPVNALLSFLYTLLTHDCRSAAEAVGLDPAVGFLHRDRPGRPSLALDMMEEFRPILADRLALSLINRRQIQAKHFEHRDGGAVWLNEKGRKIVLTAWQERKQQSARHLFLEEKAPLGLMPYLQAQLLARHLRGDIDAYPPWLWK